MAIPTLNGSSGSTRMYSTQTRTGETAMPNSGRSPTMNGTGNSAAAELHHLSCWRSTPRARRNRTTTAATAPVMLGISNNAPRLISRSSHRVQATGTPTGLSTTPSPDTSTTSGCRPLPTRANTMNPTPDPATTRQRGDSSRPVGNSSGSSTTTSVKNGANHNVPAKATHTPPGSDPGAVTSA